MNLLNQILFGAVALVGPEGIRLLFVPRPASLASKTVAKPKSELVATLISMAGFLLFAKFYKDGPPLFFLCFAAACAVNIIDYRNTKLEYDSEGFTVTNTFGRKRIYRYEEITGLEEQVTYRGPNIKKVYVGELVFSWTNKWTDAQTFEHLVVQKYKTRKEV